HVGRGASLDCVHVFGLYARFGLSTCAWTRRPVEGPHTDDFARRQMKTGSDVRSGKGHRDENFPVASWLIAKRHRPAILAFYNFVRAADDVADHPSLT